MLDLASTLADRRFNNTTKAIILLHSLGGRAQTAEIIALGIENGARGIKAWKVPSLLRSANDRVAQTPQGWLLLPKGREYLNSRGYEPSTQRSEIRNQSLNSKKTVFIGHGRSLVWLELKEFLEAKLGFSVEHFNSVSVVGTSNKERLKALLDSVDAALLVLTAEDELADGTTAPRMNVVHEVGLFQGRLGFEKAAILLEEGCAEFSNANGIGQIRFPKGRVSASTEQIRDWLARESLI